MAEKCCLKSISNEFFWGEEKMKRIEDKRMVKLDVSTFFTSFLKCLFGTYNQRVNTHSFFGCMVIPLEPQLVYT